MCLNVVNTVSHIWCLTATRCWRKWRKWRWWREDDKRWIEQTEQTESHKRWRCEENKGDDCDKRHNCDERNDCGGKEWRAWRQWREWLWWKGMIVMKWRQQRKWLWWREWLQWSEDDEENDCNKENDCDEVKTMKKMIVTKRTIAMKWRQQREQLQWSEDNKRWSHKENQENKEKTTKMKVWRESRKWREDNKDEQLTGLWILHIYITWHTYAQSSALFLFHSHLQRSDEVDGWISDIETEHQDWEWPKCCSSYLTLVWIQSWRDVFKSVQNLSLLTHLSFSHSSLLLCLQFCGQLYL